MEAGFSAYLEESKFKSKVSLTLARQVAEYKVCPFLIFVLESMER
jgi:hypothetical protein